MNLTARDLSFLVGNPDAFAFQRPDGAYQPVRLGDVYDPDHGPHGFARADWPGLLEDHLTGKSTVGTYVNRGNMARTLVFDIDKGEEEGKTDVRSVAGALVGLGVPADAIGVEFSGRKGYHVWVVFASYVVAKDLRRLGRAALAEAGVECEVFPKQDDVRDLGNLVKLPGGVHRVTGKRSEVLKPWKLLDGETFAEVLQDLPELAVIGGGQRPEAFACMAHIQDGVQEGGRNIALFHLATMLRRGGLNEENLRAVLTNANAKFDPPLEDYEVEGIVRNSEFAGPICGQLPGSMSCGDACILRRTPGLYTRPGALKHAADGEFVVMQVDTKDGVNVDLAHPDLRQGIGVLAREER